MVPGLDDFHAFSTYVGEEVVFGKIQLLVFVRSTHIEDGLVKPLNNCVSCIKTGVNLVVSNAANKGQCFYRD